MLLIIGACTSPSTSKPDARAPPDSVAQQWFDRHNDAGRQGTANLAAFYDPDVIQTNGFSGAGRIKGRANVLHALDEQLPNDEYTRDLVHGVYLGPHSAVTLERIESTGSALPEDATFLHTMTPAGIARETYAPSILASRRDHPEDVRLLAVDRLVERYLDIWSDGSGSDPTMPYTPGASLVDPFLAIEATANEFVDLQNAPMLEGGLAGSTVLQLPDYGGPAVFVAGPLDAGRPLSQLVLLFDVDMAPECRAAMAVVATLDGDGRIAQELRLHRDDDWVRCSRGHSLPSGWWETATIPEAVARVGTGKVKVGNSFVAVFNSTPSLDRLLQWGQGRFQDAGLPGPELQEITFLSPEADLCNGIHGLALADELILCLDEERACLDDGCAGWRAWSRVAVLHELAHSWIDQHVASETATAFTGMAGLPTWSSPAQPWGRRGVELAAETIAWALMDESYRINTKLGPHSREELSDLYVLLTGQSPPSRTASGWAAHLTRALTDGESRGAEPRHASSDRPLSTHHVGQRLTSHIPLQLGHYELAGPGQEG